MAEVFKVDSWFGHFTAPYRETIRAYRELLVSKAARKIDSKENDYQRAERLFAWFSMIEQAHAFESSEDARAAFAPHFLGIDTDFTSAIEAGVWGQKIKEDLLRSEELSSAFDDTGFNAALLDFVQYVPDEKIQLASDIAKSTEADEAREFLQEFLAAGEPLFDQIAESTRMRQEGLAAMAAMALETGLAEDVPFSATRNVQETLDEIIFLVHRMNFNRELREVLQDLYAGPSSDLAAIDACARYVRQVATARLPESLGEAVIGILLSARGPLALFEAKPQLERCLQSITAVKAHYGSIETVSHGQIRTLTEGASLESLSIGVLLETAQNALRQPQFFVPLVSKLKQLRAQGALRFAEGEGSPAAHAENPGALGLTVEMPGGETRGASSSSSNERNESGPL
jgi:hypothetical protein